METRCGFVALIGIPNAGKSTLLNALVGEKISIVTPKVQTTRSKLLGIALHDQTQIILIDTPGIFQPRRRLDRSMVHAAWSAPKDADLTCLLIDVSKKDLQSSVKILDELASRHIAPVLVLNKIDLIPRHKLLKIVAELTTGRTIKDTFMISALNLDGVEDFKLYLSNALPHSPWLYPEDQITNIPMRLWAAEITREKLFMLLQQELPYSTAVETSSWETFENGDIKIHQTIMVQRDGQRKIILGNGGELIKKIGQKARLDMQSFLQKKVHLFLYVKVSPEWTESMQHYQEMGLEFNT